jgi:hypothetical protein
VISALVGICQFSNRYYLYVEAVSGINVMNHGKKQDSVKREEWSIGKEGIDAYLKPMFQYYFCGDIKRVNGVKGLGVSPQQWEAFYNVFASSDWLWAYSEYNRVRLKCFDTLYHVPRFTITTKLRALSPRVNYTDLATAVCRRSWCQLLWIEVPRSQRDPYCRTLGSLWLI